MSVKVSLGGQLKLNADVINCDLCQNTTKKNTEGHKIGGFVAKDSVCVSAKNCELFISWKPLRASVPPHVEQNAI